MLQHRSDNPDPNANATISLTHDLFVKLLTRQAGVRDTVFSDDVALEGSGLDLVRFFGLLDRPDEVFDIVTP